MSSEPIMVAKIHKDFVDVKVDGKERSVTVNDFVSTMAKHIGYFASTTADTSGNRVLQVPKSFVGAVETEAGKKKKVFFYREAHRADLLLDLNRTRIGDLITEICGTAAKKKSKEVLANMAEAGIGYEGDSYPVLRFKSCALPNFVMSLNLTLNMTDKKNYAVEGVKYGYTAIPREMLKQLTRETSNVDHLCKTLGHMPFPNFYSGNGMCYGGNQVLTTLSASEENYRPLESYLNLITSSPFNLDLWNGLPDKVMAEIENAENGPCFLEAFLGKGNVEAEKLRNVKRSWGASFTVANWFMYLSKAPSFPYHLFERG